jgi:hypothetical protein
VTLEHSRRERPQLCRWLLLAILVAALSACFAFDNLPPPLDRDARPDSGARTQRGVLAERDAAYVCSLIARCDALGESVLRVSGIALSQATTGAGFSYASCTDWLTRTLEGARSGFAELRDLFSCLAATSTCDLASACTGVERLMPGAPECAGVRGKRCVGDTVLDCDQGIIDRCDAASYAPNSRCQLTTGNPAPTAVCAIGVCATPNAIRCSADAMLRCEAGLERGLRCGVLGLPCDTVGCAAQQATLGCRPGAMRCVGDELHTCVQDTESVVACAALGQRCVVDGPPGGPARCAGPANCNPRSSALNVCTGSKISVCIGERDATFDCATIGLACLPATADGRFSGRCGAI